MSLSFSRAAAASRQAIAILPVRRPAFVSVRFLSNAGKDMPIHTRSPSSDPSISQTGSETPVDYATTGRSPVTTFPQDLPEGGPIAAATISGAPVDLQMRTVRIYKPSKAATQSSHWNGRGWRMDWDVLTRGGNWENPLMGWTSSADHMQGTHLYFKTKEDAIHFAEKQGYEYYVQEPNTRQFRPKAYAANFTHSPGKLKVIRTK
ncbi:ETC complex I subunit conserved region-domain-containing protein [Kalaharituber pfeilii]|nr:ETC complex I subunit conserved region-domain-containing protein [Kalaharituber pfeilii]